MNEIIPFEYENETQCRFCEAAAQDIRAMGRKTVELVVQIGERLRQVRDILPHGKWLSWLTAYFGWSDDTARRYMKVATLASQIPQIAEFGSVDQALRFADLPVVSQQAVIQQGAYRRTDEFEQVAWDAAVRAHLLDDELDHGRRYGDALAAIEDAKDDPVLAPVAKRLYAEYRDSFARLSEREPTDVDVETGIDIRPPLPTDRVSAQFVQAERYWICEWDGQKWQPVAPIQSYVLLWPSASLLAAFPKAKDGPMSVSWGAAAEDAVCRRLNASTVARFEEVL